MITKDKLKMLGLLTYAVMGEVNYNDRPIRTKPKETDEQRKARISKAEIKCNKANGLKEFFYGENSLWAINKKNADRKARINNWL